jgi:hypothetical protein
MKRIDRQQINCPAFDHSDIRGLVTTGQWSAYSPFCLQNVNHRTGVNKGQSKMAGSLPDLPVYQSLSSLGSFFSFFVGILVDIDANIDYSIHEVASICMW